MDHMFGHKYESSSSCATILNLPTGANMSRGCERLFRQCLTPARLSPVYLTMAVNRHTQRHTWAKYRINTIGVRPFTYGRVTRNMHRTCRKTYDVYHQTYRFVEWRTYGAAQPHRTTSRTCSYALTCSQTLSRPNILNYRWAHTYRWPASMCPPTGAH